MYICWRLDSNCIQSCTTVRHWSCTYHCTIDGHWLPLPLLVWHNFFLQNIDCRWLIGPPALQPKKVSISQGRIEDITSICPSIRAFALSWNVAVPIKQMAFSQQALNLMNGLVLGPISFDQVHHIQKSISWRTIKCWSPVRLPIAHCCPVYCHTSCAKSFCGRDPQSY